MFERTFGTAESPHLPLLLPPAEYSRAHMGHAVGVAVASAILRQNNNSNPARAQPRRRRLSSRADCLLNTILQYGIGFMMTSDDSGLRGLLPVRAGFKRNPLWLPLLNTPFDPGNGRS